MKNPKSKEQFLVLLINIAKEHEACAAFTRSGEDPSQMLILLLDSALKLAKQFIASASMIGEIQNGFFAITVGEPETAANIIWNALTAAGLAPFSNLYSLDPARKNLHSVYPSKGGVLDAAELKEVSPAIGKLLEKLKDFYSRN
jgi:hypothetical protein